MSDEKEIKGVPLEVTFVADDRSTGDRFIVMSQSTGTFQNDDGTVRGTLEVGIGGGSIVIRYEEPEARAIVIRTTALLEAVTKKLFPHAKL